MKILMLNHNWMWQGTFFRCYHFGRHLVRYGHEVTIHTVRRERAVLPRSSVEDGVRIVRTPHHFGRFRLGYLNHWLLPGLFWRLLLVLKERYDVIMAFDHWPEVACPFFLAKAAGRQRLVADWADWWTEGGIFDAKLPPSSVGYRLETWLEKRTKRCADTVTVISQALRERALAIGVAPERVHYLPSGADVENIRPLPQRELRRRLGLPPAAPLIAYTGISSAPEVALLFEAFTHIAREVPDAHLLLIGPFQQAREAADLDATLKARVIAPGVVAYADLGAYLAAADLLALPLPDTVNSRARWPNKFGDYLAAGRAIVATGYGDLGPIFAQYPIGLAAAPGAEDFARQVVELLRDRERLEACGRAARELAESRLDWSLLARQLETILQQG
jgi:glycosyltransferase involved in cell wall biosynthesis